MALPFLMNICYFGRDKQSKKEVAVGSIHMCVAQHWKSVVSINTHIVGCKKAAPQLSAGTIHIANGGLAALLLMHDI